MKRKYKVKTATKTIEREYNYIPVRYIIAGLITLFEILAIIGIVVACCYYIPYFYIAAWITEIFCVIKIIASDDNPDYKVPWLLFVLILPIAGFMFYFLFYSRKLQKKFIRRLEELKKYRYEKDQEKILDKLECESAHASEQAKMLCAVSGASVFTNTNQTYYPLGEDMWQEMISDLEKAEKFIFMEYFIIEEGRFWNSILDVLKRKASVGVTVRILYDDIGCMSTLPGNYYKQLTKLGIEARPFSRLRGQADSEFNNRSHRKICVIDGKVGYTGGVNIADEYINEIERFGHWKDTALRLEGEAVWEMTRLFLTDYGINTKRLPETKVELYPKQSNMRADGYVIPFGDGPSPLYDRRVGKSVIQNMLSSATKYVYMTTPYLIIDNELCGSIENAALRGVDVRIIVPHIPDKKIVFGMTRSFYHRLIKSGVKIYEYKPGFIHAKSYIADDEYAMIGTINLDYRSLVHHFENGVWMYRCDSITDLKQDIEETMAKSIEITPDMLKTGPITRLIRSVVRIFAPML
ncbi:MAG: cardiolipin synthase [Ruminococcaceae bacterium]|nr:cardiolipin synthase [Oscillospiraceae bacterium]